MVASDENLVKTKDIMMLLLLRFIYRGGAGRGWADAVPQTFPSAFHISIGIATHVLLSLVCVC
jgi:hypothetical protein